MRQSTASDEEELWLVNWQHEFQRMQGLASANAYPPSRASESKQSGALLGAPLSKDIGKRRLQGGGIAPETVARAPLQGPPQLRDELPQRRDDEMKA